MANFITLGPPINHHSWITNGFCMSRLKTCLDTENLSESPVVSFRTLRLDAAFQVRGAEIAVTENDRDSFFWLAMEPEDDIVWWGKRCLATGFWMILGGAPLTKPSLPHHWMFHRKDHPMVWTSDLYSRYIQRLSRFYPNVSWLKHYVPMIDD